MTKLPNGFDSRVNKNSQKVDPNFFRDEKVFQLILLGWSQVRIAEELDLHRATVRSIIDSVYGQKRLAEMASTLDDALVGLPELVILATQKIKQVLEGDNHHPKQDRVKLDAARLVFGVAARFHDMQLNRDVRTVKPIHQKTDLVESP